MTKRLLTVCLVAVLAVLGANAQTKSMNQLAKEAEKALKRGNYAKADSLYALYVDRFKTGGHTRNFEYSEILSYLVQRLSRKGRINEAIELQEEVIEVRRTASDCTYAQWAASTSDLAALYSKKGDYDQSIQIGEQALEMLRTKFGKKHNFYCIALANQANYYSARGMTGDGQTAVQLCEQALKHMKRGTPEYASALNALVLFYSQVGNRAMANKLSKKAISEARKRLNEDHINGAIVLNNNAIRLANAGNYEQALEFIQTAKEFYEAEGQNNTLAYSKILSNMSTYYSHLHRYQEAAALLEQALPIIEQATNKQHPDYVRCLSDLSAVYKGLGNLDKAGELAHESDRLGRSMRVQDNMNYAKSLSKQAATFASNGNYQRAMEHERKAIDIFANRKDSVNMAFAMGELANYMFAAGQQQQALTTAEQALDIFRRRQTISAYYAQALNNTAILYYNADRYEQASDYGQRSLAMYRQLGDTVNAVYARILSNNALFHFVERHNEQAVETALRAVDLHQRLLGNTHPDNVPLLYNLSVYQMQTRRWAQSLANYQQALSIQADQVRTGFLHLTSQERETFWNQKSYVFKFAPLLAYLFDRGKQDGADTLATDAFNAILFTKGILLNSDIDFRNLLKRTGDERLLKKYNQLADLKDDERNLYKQTVDERDASALKKIQEEIYQLERDLVRGCKEYGSFTEGLGINAEKIRQSLHDDEAAIEFADIYLNGIGTTYLALLLRKDSPCPRLIRLFSDEDLKDLKYGSMTFRQALKDEKGTNLIYNDTVFGRRLWQPIMNHLQGISKIYFSPASMYYQIGIEYLPCDSRHRIGDLYAVYRLSSTKSLAHRQPSDNIKSATIYGGLNYDMSLDEIQAQHQRHALEETRALLAYENVRAPYYVAGMQRTLDSLSVRGSVNYLEGTRNEAFNIAEQLMQNNVDTQVLMDNEGTEETFKQLSGTSRSIIHIATHGFSFSESEVKGKENLLVFIDAQNDNLDNMLNYSGLLLSGANYALKGQRLPDGYDDGVLTAREIAQVDLGKVEIVVLSACQTALGEIREDGVFGIQRGFKKAGARSLLMSLWKVDDAATEIMMTAFYQHLMAGHTRHKAFRMAQQAVRDRGYRDPYYWASFILLDDQE